MTAAASAFNRWAGPGIVKALRARVTGSSNVPRSGGVLLAANHLSFLDHVLLSAAAPRPLRFLGKTELTRGIGGRINLAFGMVPIERGRGDLASLDIVIDLLRAGHAVAIFPEGTRSPTGELFRFRSGLARVAATARAPVVPVGLTGTNVVWPRGEKPQMKRPAKGILNVAYGAPLSPPDPDGRSRREFTERLHSAVAALTGQPRADKFAAIS